jgi:predicted nucleotidyltransferase
MAVLTEASIPNRWNQAGAGGAQMANSREIPQVLDDLVQNLAAWAVGQAAIDALYLFGSQAEGRARAHSDVDIAVLTGRDVAKEHLWRLEDRWAAAWPGQIDLHVLNLAPIPAQFEVITRGQRLWQRSLERVAEYESWVRRRYWDLEPRLERDWQAFVARIQEQRNDAERQEYQAARAHVGAVHRRAREAADAHVGRVQK